MTYKDLENKINQNKIAIRYNIVVEGAAIKPEEYPEVKEGLPTEEPFKSIALGVLYEDKAKVLSDVKESLENEISPLDIINKGLMKGIDAVSLLYTKGVYFLPDLMLAGDAMMESVKECEKVLGHKSETKGTVVCFVFMTGTALMTTTMTAFPKVVDALEKEGLEVPAIGCGGGAVRKDYVESMPMTVYGVEAYHTPKLADAILKNHKTWEDLRKEYSDIVGEFVPEYSN